MPALMNLHSALPVSQSSPGPRRFGTLAVMTIDVERIRFSLEPQLAKELEALPAMQMRREAVVPRDPASIRRRVLADALRLMPTMAPAAFEQASAAAKALGVEGELEIYQSSGRENAVLHLVEKPVMLEVQGRMLSLLDDGSGRALFGHELGHYLAHGPWTDLGATAIAAMVLAESGYLTQEQVRLALKLSVAREITADRFGLLACRDLDAALRLEMIATTGLSGEALTWDTQAYLAQCRELMEGLLERGETALSTTHPEHSMRGWAVWLFSETDVYKELTGEGPATRTLADVDAVLEKVLGVSAGQVALDVREEPPSFLQECALACAVLVAQADGEVAPEELAAIEDAFSQSVPGWSEFLDTEVALERFYETAHMVRAGGPDLAQRLFFLMVHVMGADDIVEDAEIEMILSIGEALGFRREFSAWLTPALRAMGAEVEIPSEAPKPIPLPTRKKDVEDAVAALCDLVDRQRHTRISLRRLCRLAGRETVADDAVAELAERLSARGIEAEPSLSQAKPDEPIVLSSTLEPAAKEGTAEPMSEDRAGLMAALTRLRDELVSGDGRSPSVRLRRLRKGREFDMCRLDGIKTGAAERALTLLRTGKAASLVSAEEAGKHDTAHSCSEELRMLDRTNRDRREETGANELYLGYPLLIGSVGRRKSKGPAYGVRAPLMLFPVDLVRDGRGARGFSVEHREDEPPFVNHSLLRVLFNKSQLAMPDEFVQELDELAGSESGGVQAILARLSEVGVAVKPGVGPLVPFERRDDELDGDVRFVSVEETALLGIFPQSSSDLLHDYDELLRDLEDSAKSLPEVLSAAQGLLPSALRDDVVMPEALGEAPFPVLPSDPSQRKVAEECRRNQITVVDGPPGTGKSQLIVNLVADALGRGERVAVVAEKRAAIDVVFQRLDARGLGDSAALVHDVNDDRKALFRKISERLNDFTPRKASKAAIDAEDADYKRVDETLGGHLASMSKVVATTEMTVGQLMAVAASGEAVVEAPLGKNISRAQLEEILEVVERLRPLTSVWQPSSFWRSQEQERPQGMHELDDAEVASLLDALEDAIGKRRHFETLDAESALGSPETATTAVAAYRAAVNEATSEEDRVMLRAAIAHGSASESELLGLCEGQERALSVWKETTPWEFDEAFSRNVAVMRSYAGRWTRIFSGLWWKTRGSVRQALAALWPEKAASSFSPGFLSEIGDRMAASRAFRAGASLAEVLSLPLPKESGRLVAWGGRLGELRSHAQALATQQERLSSLGLSLDGDVSTEMLELREKQLAAFEEVALATSPLQSAFPWAGESDAGGLSALKEQFRDDAHRLRESDGRMAQLDTLVPNALALLDALLEALPSAGAAEWREAVARAWARSHLSAAEVSDPTLREAGSTGRDQELSAAMEAMTQGRTKRSDLEVDRILERMDSAELLQIPDAEYRARRTPKQKAKEKIQKEVAKSRSLMSLRRFVREFAVDGLLDVLPCWLLSPETMAVLFPREPLFDLVIFDEASQCTVEAGFPVMTRAKRVVVAGDEKQMPPSSYFSLGESATEDEDRSEDEVKARGAFSSESLLALARTRCPHAGLKWHYRCRREELIAFSNHSMYEGELLTIPSVDSSEPTSALKWIDVADGAYDAGLNRPEARRVVDLMEELLARTPSPTIGVVTFNLKQRQTILDMVDERLADSEKFSELWRAANGADSLDERPFVKNLESVQGDEREIIIFSLGHAPVERKRKGGKSELYVPARFGPLGQRGGERRLNVAISRAKAECYIVSSFDPKLLHVGNAKNDGPRLFKGFLSFAHHMSAGHMSQANQVLDDVRGISIANQVQHRQRQLIDGYLPLASQIALAAEDMGLKANLNVGSSEFRIPLSIGKPGEPAQLAIMTWEGEQATSPFAHYVHEPAVLALRGWKILHVSPATWLRRPSDVLRDIEGLLG